MFGYLDDLLNDLLNLHRNLLGHDLEANDASELVSEGVPREVGPRYYGARHLEPTGPEGVVTDIFGVLDCVRDSGSTGVPSKSVLVPSKSVLVPSKSVLGTSQVCLGT
eukprot:3712245-Rhodomonas_salina.1